MAITGRIDKGSSYKGNVMNAKKTIGVAALAAGTAIALVTVAVLLHRSIDSKLTQINDTAGRAEAELRAGREQQNDEVTKIVVQVTLARAELEAERKATGDKIDSLQTQLKTLASASEATANDDKQRIEALRKELLTQRAESLNTEMRFSEKIGTLQAKLLAASEPRVGQREDVLVEVMTHYGDEEFSFFLNRDNAVEAPSAEVVTALRALHEAAEGKAIFTEKKRITPWAADGKAAPEGTKTAPSWQVSFERKERRGIDKAFEKPMPTMPTIMLIEAHRTGLKVTWSKQPEEAQLKRTAEKLRRVAELLGLTPGASYWHDAKTFVFRP